MVISERDPIQEWSAIHVDEDKESTCGVFHAHLKYPYAAEEAAAYIDR